MKRNRKKHKHTHILTKPIINAYIDGANLDKGVKGLKWKLDYQRFYQWLKDKYKISKAYIFIGLVPKFKDIYTHLQEIGYILVFKETVEDDKGKVKGNCDADLVLNMVRDYYEKKYDQAILISSDGDYASMAKFLLEKKKLKVIISPNNRCSILLKRTLVPISYLREQKSKLVLHRKNPR